MNDSRDLQAVLNALPEPAIVLSRDYEILLANEPYRQVYGFDPAGTDAARCYRVSHGYPVPCDQAGESCPLRQSLRTRRTSRVLHVHHTPRGDEYVNVEMWPIMDPDSGDVMYFIERMHPSAAAASESGDEPLVGTAPRFREMLNMIERVARSNSTVMLLGETGTGKEVVAESIHRLSDRRSKPFVPVECTGMPETLFEAEMFGYVKGAFTGASANRTGLVEAAEGGTLFLDEIGEIPLSDQVKLLRLLETRRFRRVGSSEWQRADFRLVCATNRDLAAMVETGEFRQDLYFRLNVFDIRLPPLRERIDDVELLIASILRRLGKREYRCSAAALACLRSYRFPGNIRELRNIIERATLLAEDKLIDVPQLPAQCRQRKVSAAEGLPTQIVPLAEAEQRYLLHALAIHRGDRKSLAQALGISERALYRKLAAARPAAAPAAGDGITDR